MKIPHVRRVVCRHFGDEREGLEAPPFPGSLGQEIYEHVSRDAWEAWLRRQTMIINEYRLVVTDPKARRLLDAEMRAFLFGGLEQGNAETVAPPEEKERNRGSALP